MSQIRFQCPLNQRKMLLKKERMEALLKRLTTLQPPPLWRRPSQWPALWWLCVVMIDLA